MEEIVFPRTQLSLEDGKLWWQGVGTRQEKQA